MSGRRARREGAPDVATFRAGVLRAAGHLDLDEPRVAGLAEALTGHPWDECDTADLRQVLQALRQLVERCREPHPHHTAEDRSRRGRRKRGAS
jgi:hypothetical protein